MTCFDTVLREQRRRRNQRQARSLRRFTFTATGLTLVLIIAGGCSSEENQSLTPTSSVTENRLTDDELRAELAASLAEEYDIKDPPEVTLIREVPPDEASKVQSECMMTAGWPNQILPNGAVEYDYTDDQTEDFNLALYTCELQYPVEAKYTRPLDDTQWAMMYDHFVNEYIPCAEAEGYNVGEIPSKDSYLAMPVAEKWFPGRLVRMEITTGGGGKYNSVEEFEAVCPPTPELDVLYGGD